MELLESQNSLLPIAYYPNSMLKDKSVSCDYFKDVEKPPNFLQDLAKKMISTMYAEGGLGLSAVQVFQPINMFVVSPLAANKNESTPAMVCMDPKILEYSKETEIVEEGCLSFPNLFINVKRSKSVVLEYTDIHGMPYTIKCSGLVAQVVQHEYDHLQGTLFIDHLSHFKKEMTMKKYKKSMKNLGGKNIYDY